MTEKRESLSRSRVGLTKIKHLDNKNEIKHSIFYLLDHMKNINMMNIKDRSKIMIKPNICSIQGYETGATVDPLLVKYLVEWLLQNYNVEIITIGEADATSLNADLAFKALGWVEIFNNFKNVKLLNLSKDELIKVKLNGLYFNDIYMSKTYLESDFLISIAKLKSHAMCGITCILKNQFGSNPIKNKSRYHKHLKKVIHDLNKIKIPNLCLVDGIIGMEGASATVGIPKPSGIIIIGNDPVAVDHACARVMDINPHKISYLTLAHKYHLGSFIYTTFGEEISDVKKIFIVSEPYWKKIIVSFALSIRKIRNFL